MEFKETISEQHWEVLKKIEQNGLDTLKFQHVLNGLASNGKPLALEQLLGILSICVKKK